MIYLFLTPFFFLVILGYFRVADYYNIIDKPNERSSHSQITIRGGGIVYLVAALTALILHPQYWMPVLALFVIGMISFADDRITLSNRVRLIFHLAAVSILFGYLEVFNILPWWTFPLIYISVIGVINAYNFMDGINGITGIYSLVVLAGLQYVNCLIIPFIHQDMIWLPMLATIVFLFFNFRTSAKCFAGDVGSITVALWIVLLLLRLLVESGNFGYILFLSVYGVDSVLTIIHRLMLRQNIFKAHRLHFYQLLANEHRISHLSISAGYGFVQLAVISLVLFSSLSVLYLAVASLVPLISAYVAFKPRLMTVSRSK